MAGSSLSTGLHRGCRVKAPHSRRLFVWAQGREAGNGIAAKSSRASSRAARVRHRFARSAIYQTWQTRLSFCRAQLAALLPAIRCIQVGAFLSGIIVRRFPLVGPERSMVEHKTQ